MDYYLPSFFNNLPPAIQYKAARRDIVLPHTDMATLFTKTGDEALDDDTLFNLHKERLFSLYNWPDDLDSDIEYTEEEVGAASGSGTMGDQIEVEINQTGGASGEEQESESDDNIYMAD